jgi:hypothetical protein
MACRLGLISFMLIGSCGLPAHAAQPPGSRAIGPGTVIVHAKFGGQIFGFDIDQNGTEGVLAEAKTLGNGQVLAAIETFDQATGAILDVVEKNQKADEYIALGITGQSIALIEDEYAPGLYVKRRTYPEINPLSANALTGLWPAPLKKDDIIFGISRAQGTANTAFYGIVNRGIGEGFVLGSNVGAGTFGPRIRLKNPVFAACCGAQVAYDSTTNQAVLASSTGAVGGPPPVIALADLATGKVEEFKGLPGPPPYRAGFINGLAVDAADGIACTTTELDFRVEYYDLQTKKGSFVVLPGASSQIQSGADVEFDPVNKLFLVAQPESSSVPNASSIYVYDISGNLVESLNGFHFLVTQYIALNPATRTGYVNGPTGVSELQSFTY